MTIADIREKAAAEVAADIAANGGTARAQAVDVSDPAAVEAQSEEIKTRYAKLFRV